jgi:hypothetical protein
VLIVYCDKREKETVEDKIKHLLKDSCYFFKLEAQTLNEILKKDEKILEELCEYWNIDKREIRRLTMQSKSI